MTELKIYGIFLTLSEAPWAWNWTIFLLQEPRLLRSRLLLVEACPKSWNNTPTFSRHGRLPPTDHCCFGWSCDVEMLCIDDAWDNVESKEDSLAESENNVYNSCVRGE